MPESFILLLIIAMGIISLISLIVIISFLENYNKRQRTASTGRYSRRQASQDANDPELAIAEYTKKISGLSGYGLLSSVLGARFNPKEAYLKRGEAYLAAGQLTDAIRDFEAYCLLTTNAANRKEVYDKIQEIKAGLPQYGKTTAKQKGEADKDTARRNELKIGQKNWAMRTDLIGDPPKPQDGGKAGGTIESSSQLWSKVGFQGLAAVLVILILILGYYSGNIGLRKTDITLTKIKYKTNRRVVRSGYDEVTIRT